MTKSQKRGIRNMKRKENMTPPKMNNHTRKDLIYSEGDETSIFKLKRIMTAMVNEMKEDMQKHDNEIREFE
jgi:hypothetical protein